VQKYLGVPGATEEPRGVLEYLGVLQDPGGVLEYVQYLGVPREKHA